MYEVYKTNFGHFYDPYFNTVEEAINYGRERGFEFSVHEVNGGKMIGYASGARLQWHKR